MRIKPNAAHIKDFKTETSADNAAEKLQKKAGCQLRWIIAISGKNSDRFTPVFILNKGGDLPLMFIPDNGYLVVG